MRPSVSSMHVICLTLPKPIKDPTPTTLKLATSIRWDLQPSDCHNIKTKWFRKNRFRKSIPIIHNILRKGVVLTRIMLLIRFPSWPLILTITSEEHKPLRGRAGLGRRLALPRHQGHVLLGPGRGHLPRGQLLLAQILCLGWQTRRCHGKWKTENMENMKNMENMEQTFYKSKSF